MNFITKFDKPDINNLFTGKIKEELLRDLDISITDSNIRVDWDIELEAREWGVKSMIISVKSVYGNIGWEISEDELSESDIKHITEATGGVHYNNGSISGSVALSSRIDGFTIIDKDFTVKSDTVYPEEVEINFKTKTVTISNG